MMVPGGKQDLGDEASAIRGLARAGAPSHEVHLSLGRLCEKAGRLEPALAHFRKAWLQAPQDLAAAFELARALTRSGRKAEAGRSWQRFSRLALKALAGPPDPLLPTLLLDADSRAALSALARPGRTHVVASCRRLLVREPGAAGVRALLVECLISGRRFKEAGAALAEALDSGRGWEPVSSAASLVRLIEAGAFSARLERAVLRALAGTAGQGFPQVYSALVCSRRFRSAFLYGEAVLDAFGPGPIRLEAAWPWFRMGFTRGARAGICQAESEALSKAWEEGRLRPWFSHCRTLLINNTGRYDRERLVEARAECRRIMRMDLGRYWWLLPPLVMVKFMSGPEGLQEAVDLGRAALGRAPDEWGVRCRVAEALLCLGEEARGLAEFEEAVRLAPPVERGGALTWQGEALLWLGRYSEARSVLDAAVAAGSTVFVFGWRGGAALKLGDLKAALSDLDHALDLDRFDMEAYVWRGEALRLLGRHQESLRDLDHHIKAFGSLWSHLNRGLARCALADAAGMLADLKAACKRWPEETAYIRERAGLPRAGALSVEQSRRFMEQGLRFGMGVRREERHLNGLWMRPFGLGARPKPRPRRGAPRA
ncbi:MAG: tetratricopeptide repeat protein [Elusimicrobia bacterium]|nr:tetratricopeptide repeat protein [Elusimicrobiota bacterium]